MGGGLMQLVAYGAQDIYLTGNPQITFFKVVYRRHTNFAMECIQQTLNGTSACATSGNSGSVTVSRNGDLVHKIYVRVVSDSATANVTDGNDIISNVELEIGGQKIDKHYTEWNKVWNELTTPDSKASALKAMTGGSGSWGGTTETNNSGVNYCQLPLNFWFCRNPGLALPLIALQYHEVKLKFTWGGCTTASTASVWCDYIYLDTDERRRFAQVSHEYLIEQLQLQSEGTAKSSYKLNFNHPVKELIWTYTNATEDRTTLGKLKLNGHDRFAEEVGEYFQLRQPMDHHTAVPGQNLPNAVAGSGGLEIISGHGGNGTLGCDIDKGFGATTPLAVGKFNIVKANGAGTAVANGTVAAAGVLRSGILAVGGTDALSGFKKGSLRVGDFHLIQFMDNVTAATGHNAGSTHVAKITGFFNDSASTTTGAGIGPVAAGETVTGLADATFDVSTMYILYDHPFQLADGAATVCIAAADTDTLLISKLNGASQSRTSTLTSKVNCYSFALKPEEHQPSGTCNFSRIDNAQLVFSGTEPTVNTIYAVNYNVLRIMSGMGGLAYSN
jgi:hypothetical protein